MRLKTKNPEEEKQTLKQLEKEILSQTTPSVTQYWKEYHQDTDDFEYHPNKQISLSDLIYDIQTRRSVCLGDFHTFDGSKELLETILENTPDRNKALGLETFYLEHQLHLDNYFEGYITEDELLDLANYDELWEGCAQTPIKNVLKKAKDNCVRIIALNNPMIDRDDPNGKDELASQIISRYLNNNLNNLMITFYGDLHVGNNHLDTKIDMKLEKHPTYNNNTLSIRQNDPNIFWKCIEAGVEIPTLIKLNIDEVCYLNENPLEVMQSFIDSLETYEIDNEGYVIVY